MPTVTATSNQYTRFMSELFDENAKVKVPSAFLGGFFGKSETGAVTHFVTDASTIEIDQMRVNGRRLARLVNRGTHSKDISREETLVADKYTNIVRQFPLIEIPASIAANELLNRNPGETPFDLVTQQSRLLGKAARLHREAVTRHMRTWEFLAREAVLTGEHPMILGTANAELKYDFYRKSTHTFAAGAKWDVVGTDIIGEFDTAIDLIQQDSNNFGDYGALVGVSGMEGLRKNTQMKAEADIRRYEFVELGERPINLPSKFQIYIDHGFALAGKVRTYQNRTVYLFTYDLTFTDDFTTPGVDTETKWMPADKCLIFSPDARCDKLFGPPNRIPHTAVERQWFAETFGFDMDAGPMPDNVMNPSTFDMRAFYFDADSSRDAVRLYTQSAPIFPTTETDAFVTITGLV